MRLVYCAHVSKGKRNAETTPISWRLTADVWWIQKLFREVARAVICFSYARAPARGYHTSFRRFVTKFWLRELPRWVNIAGFTSIYNWRSLLVLKIRWALTFVFGFNPIVKLTKDVSFIIAWRKKCFSKDLYELYLLRKWEFILI